MQWLRTLPIPLKIVAIAAAVLAVAAGMGVVAALTLGANEGPPQGAKPEQVGGANPEQGGRSQEGAEKGASDAQYTKDEGAGGSSEAAYPEEVASIQNGSVEASLRNNDKLLRYDRLTADDIEEMKADYVALESYGRRAKDLDPPTEYEDQHDVFVLAIGELRDANELAYRLATDPFSATQADFEAYDHYVDRATVYLRRSNDMLGKDYKTTRAAQEISLG
jgi:NADPH-dependent glutamate synthase beta subunit-like oxidoreductase